MSCKIIVLGESGVGKTSVIKRYTENTFSEHLMATIGADFTSFTVKIDKKEVDLQIWDTAGEERFHSVGSAFYRGTDAVILVYDCTKRKTLEKLEVWKNELFSKADIEDESVFPIIVFSNKSDLTDLREISPQEGSQWANKHGCMHMDVSAKSGLNISAGFEIILRTYLQNAPEKTNFVIRPVPIGKPAEKKLVCCK